MKSFLHLLFSMAFFTSCGQTTTTIDNTTTPPSAAKTTRNVSYGPDTLQRMDIYLPAGRTTTHTPAIILIHGGGWNSGSKEQFATYIHTFKSRLPHYAIFNIDYRLVSENNRFPTQEQDVQRAIHFIMDSAAEYHINKDNVVLLGASAGAHLALLQAYKYQQPNIKAVIDFFGPTDLLAMYQHPWHPMIPFLMQMLTGTTPEANTAIYQQSSPAYFVTPSSAPTLILQGGSDTVVDPSQSKLLNEKLQQAGVPHQLIIYPKERHGWYGANLTDSFDHIIAFLQQHVPTQS